MATRLQPAEGPFGAELPGGGGFAGDLKMVEHGGKILHGALAGIVLNKILMLLCSIGLSGDIIHINTAATAFAIRMF